MRSRIDSGGVLLEQIMVCVPAGRDDPRDASRADSR